MAGFFKRGYWVVDSQGRVGICHVHHHRVHDEHGNPVFHPDGQPMIRFENVVRVINPKPDDHQQGDAAGEEKSLDDWRIAAWDEVPEHRRFLGEPELLALVKAHKLGYALNDVDRARIQPVLDAERRARDIIAYQSEFDGLERAAAAGPLPDDKRRRLRILGRELEDLKAEQAEFEKSK